MKRYTGVLRVENLLGLTIAEDNRTVGALRILQEGRDVDPKCTDPPAIGFCHVKGKGPHSRSTILEIANFSPQLRDGDLLLYEMILGLRFRAGAHLQAHVREWLAWPSSTSFPEISIPLNPEICLQSQRGPIYRIFLKA